MEDDWRVAHYVKTVTLEFGWWFDFKEHDKWILLGLMDVLHSVEDEMLATLSAVLERLPYMGRILVQDFSGWKGVGFRDVEVPVRCFARVSQTRTNLYTIEVRHCS